MTLREKINGIKTRAVVIVLLSIVVLVGGLLLALKHRVFLVVAGVGVVLYLYGKWAFSPYPGTVVVNGSQKPSWVINLSQPNQHCFITRRHRLLLPA